ncbi:hypothetical protein LOTGIDRAFT_230584 [Lottia gigantea]|uniref:Beta-lactamase-related domain-containing protein n=1 Tax=Lottia gigantea TaxID=225164 RepID=V4AX94_LOTGI|nr:hypothetical protein LOTGIDRAFT_230584 [Lottia gigantea]ESP02198.1 hypothetical protein LOTGIDRAFT_230584 [Lottia gigantea]
MDAIWNILAVALVASVVNCDVFTTQQIQDLDDFIQNAMSCRHVPGLTLGVVKGNQSWTKGYGFADRENNRKVDANTLFGIGSITKFFTTTLLSILIDESNKKYTWDTKLSDILGKDFKLNTNLRTTETTIKDILCHRTGLQSGDMGIFAGYPSNFTRARMTGLLQYLDEIRPFRDGFQYNNWMYALAGHLVEVISGNSWLEELQTRILDPVEMTETRVLSTNIPVTDEKMAKPYVMIGEEVVPSASRIYNIHPEQPAGAIASSANDMVKWIQMILNKGNVTDNVIANWDTLETAFKPHTSVPLEGWNKPIYPISHVQSGYGFGWFISNHNGYRLMWHTGGLFGYTANLWVFPDLDIGIFSNVNGPGLTVGGARIFEVIFSYIFDMLMDQPPWLNETTACTFPMPWHPENYPKSSTLNVTNEPVENTKQYTGIYGHRLFGEVHITAQESTLFIKAGLMNGVLNTTNVPDSFKMQIVGDYEFFSNQNNVTTLLPVTFFNKTNDKFQDVLFILAADKGVFKRGVVWGEGEKGEDSDNSTSTLSSSSLLHIGLNFIIYYCINQ